MLERSLGDQNFCIRVREISCRFKTLARIRISVVGVALWNSDPTDKGESEIETYNSHNPEGCGFSRMMPIIVLLSWR